MSSFHEKAVELFGDLLGDWTEEEIAEIALDLYDLTGIDLSEPPDDPFENMSGEIH